MESFIAPYKYRPLSSDLETRVVRLLTDRDDQRFSSGIIHCTIEHVMLESSLLTGQAKSKKLEKGSNGN